MFTLTIGEYEDALILGTYATEAEALAALGRYVLTHDGTGNLYPHITENGDGPSTSTAMQRLQLYGTLRSGVVPDMREALADGAKQSDIARATGLTPQAISKRLRTE